MAKTEEIVRASGTCRRFRSDNEGSITVGRRGGGNSTRTRRSEGRMGREGTIKSRSRRKWLVPVLPRSKS